MCYTPPRIPMDLLPQLDDDVGRDASLHTVSIRNMDIHVVHRLQGAGR